MTTSPRERLRVGFVGSGFIAHFHLKSMIGSFAPVRIRHKVAT